METKDYLGYIAYFVKNVDQVAPRPDYVRFFKKHLGAAMFSAPVPKIRDVARLMYKGYIGTTYTRYGAFYLISKLDSTQIDKFINETVAIAKKYDVYYDTIDRDLSNTAIDKNIKKFALANYKSILADYSDDVPKKAVAKKTATKSTAPKKTASKTTIPKKTTTTAKRTLVITTTPKKPVRKTATKGKKASKSCADYKVPELKDLARTLKVPYYSKMNKTELCKALKIK
jgi:hypothetical protein